NVEDENDSAVVKEIKRILNQEIRPAVAMDGGDISFHSYQDGRLLLEMRGSCSGCPSSTYTLKEGIETRLKASIPDLKEVLSV
ncbi:MAG: NifU family protein, partial [Bdellovibrionales bacterium]|nr:NifU family protein [Bdellovibrionales bacterium]